MTKDEFSLRLYKDCAVKPGAHVLAAVSGGADSMALLCFLLEICDTYPLRLSCAHVEHGVRGAQSMEDMAFVREVCARNGVAFFAAHVDAPGYAEKHGCGLEDAARTLRYAFLYSAAEEAGADVIALAHHAGDQAETVLLHAVRGCDMRGLCGMTYRSGRLVRPLLGCAPQELRAYLTSAGQQWREDATNAEVEYARNRIRHMVMPELERVNTGAADALCRLSRSAQRDEDYFARQVDALDLRMTLLPHGGAFLREQLDGLHPALLSRALVRMAALSGFEPQSARAIQAIMQALEQEEASVNLTGGAHAVIGRKYLCLVRADQSIGDTALAVPGVTDTPFGRFEVRAAAPDETGDGKREQRMPARLLSGAVIGARRQGDTMIPFGRHTPVKVKKLMIDAGIERAMRAGMPLLRSAEGEVLMVFGLRCAEACRDARQEEQMIVRFCGGWPCADGEQTIGRN